MSNRFVALLGLVFFSAVAGNVLAHSPNSSVRGEKLDSGLGSLPHFSLWADKTGRDPMGVRVAGESIDDGLGELPHYRQWKDRSGHDPMGVAGARVATIRR